MNSTLKTAIAVAAALVVGLLVGYVLGSSGKRRLAQAVEHTQKRATEAESALKQQRNDCDRAALAARTAKHVLLTKEQLLRATVELSVNNYGLASQHLGVARGHLRSLTKALSKGKKKHHEQRAHKLFEQIAGAQTLVMRLDPMARVQIEQVLAELQKLPGAR